MQDGQLATLILAILGALISWTCTVVGLVIWLTGKFRSLEKLVYQEMDMHRRDDDKQFNALGVRVQRLEIKSFGYGRPAIAEPTDLGE